MRYQAPKMAFGLRRDYFFISPYGCSTMGTGEMFNTGRFTKAAGYTRFKVPSTLVDWGENKRENHF